jgi:hypothetical protein
VSICNPPPDDNPCHHCFEPRVRWNARLILMQG